MATIPEISKTLEQYKNLKANDKRYIEGIALGISLAREGGKSPTKNADEKPNPATTGEAERATTEEI